MSLSHVMSRLPHRPSSGPAMAHRPFRVLTVTITVSQGLRLQLHLWIFLPVFISGRTLSTFLCAIWLLRWTMLIPKDPLTFAPPFKHGSVSPSGSLEHPLQEYIKYSGNTVYIICYLFERRFGDHVYKSSSGDLDNLRVRRRIRCDPCSFTLLSP